MTVLPPNLESRLLDEWQRDFPLVPRPFEAIAGVLSVSESDVIAELCALRSKGTITRVGGVVRANTLGASTLAAMAVPALEADRVGALLAAEPGINHVYLRENNWNLWFVVTGPDRTYVDSVLDKIRGLTGQRVLDLKLERPFHIDLGFSLSASKPRRPNTDDLRTEPMTYVAEPGDRDLAQAMTSGLPLVPRPYQQIGDQLAMPEERVLRRLSALLDAGVLKRIGVIVRHRALGWRSNAMVVWDIEPEFVDEVGRRLARVPSVSLCYRRKRYEDAWPYNLYCMVHARSRKEALDNIEDAAVAAGILNFPHEILFSVRCYKQIGAMVAHPKEAA